MAYRVVLSHGGDGGAIYATPDSQGNVYAAVLGLDRGYNPSAPNFFAVKLDPKGNIVYSLPLKRYIDKEAIAVCVSSWRRVADNAIPARAKPTAAYLNSALARREATDNGFDEAILLTDHGTVSEGSA